MAISVGVKCYTEGLRVRMLFVIIYATSRLSCRVDALKVCEAIIFLYSISLKEYKVSCSVQLLKSMLADRVLNEVGKHEERCFEGLFTCSSAHRPFVALAGTTSRGRRTTDPSDSTQQTQLQVFVEYSN